MNLPQVYELMHSAHEQRREMLGSPADREVRLMATAGLVEAIFDDGKDGSFTSITHVTPTGQTFLRAFKDFPIPPPPILPLAEYSFAAA
jgi:hypothetical protein